MNLTKKFNKDANKGYAFKNKRSSLLVLDPLIVRPKDASNHKLNLIEEQKRDKQPSPKTKTEEEFIVDLKIGRNFKVYDYFEEHKKFLEDILEHEEPIIPFESLFDFPYADQLFNLNFLPKQENNEIYIEKSSIICNNQLKPTRVHNLAASSANLLRLNSAEEESQKPNYYYHHNEWNPLEEFTSKLNEEQLRLIYNYEKRKDILRKESVKQSNISKENLSIFSNLNKRNSKPKKNLYYHYD